MLSYFIQHFNVNLNTDNMSEIVYPIWQYDTSFRAEKT